MTNAACSVALVGDICVSNGKSCIGKAACSSYTSEQACNGGGTDGVCVYVSNLGNCKLMSACNDANNDWIACHAMSEACSW